MITLALGEAFVVGKLHRLLERRIIVAGVVDHDHRGLVREFLTKFLRRSSAGILSEFARADFDQPLDHEGRFRPAGAAIGVDRHGVGIDRIDLAIDLRDVVLARQQRRIEISRHRRREGRHIGAEIGYGLGAKAEDLAVAVEGHFSMSDMSRPCASVRNASERSETHFTGRPTLRRPQSDDFLRVDENLRAEAAADVRRDHTQLVLGRHADEGGDDETSHMRILRGFHSVAGHSRNHIGDRGARFHRVRHQAIVDDIEPGDVLGRLRTAASTALASPRCHLVDRIVRRDIVNLRHALLLCFRRIGYRGQDRIVDFHLLRGVARLRQRLRNHHRNRIADVIDVAIGERRMGPTSSSASRPWSGSSSRR